MAGLLPLGRLLCRTRGRANLYRSLSPLRTRRAASHLPRTSQLPSAATAHSLAAPSCLHALSEHKQYTPLTLSTPPAPHPLPLPPTPPSRLRPQVAKPFWTESEQKKDAWLMLAGVVAMSLGTTGISVGFNFLGRDFFNAISTKARAGTGRGGAVSPRSPSAHQGPGNFRAV